MITYKQVVPVQGQFAIFEDMETKEYYAEPLFAIAIMVDKDGEEFLTGISAGSGVMLPCINSDSFVDYVSLEDEEQICNKAIEIYKKIIEKQKDSVG